MKHIVWLAALPLLALPALALAADGYATGNVNLRAGPDAGYPLIDTIPAGAPLDIQGCTGGWEWCDVVFQGERGWVAGNFIQYDYDNQYVLVPQYGARIGIPVVTFVIGTYWDNYYRNRPFYRERSRWYARPMPQRPPPPPMHRPVPPYPGGRPPRPVRPLPDRHPQPVPPHATPYPSPRPTVPMRPSPSRPPENARPPQSGMPPHAPATRPGTGKPGAAHGRPTPKGRDDHHQDH